MRKKTKGKDFRGTFIGPADHGDRAFTEFYPGAYADRNAAALSVGGGDAHRGDGIFLPGCRHGHDAHRGTDGPQAGREVEA